ncbi:APC family permease [Proteiniborus sp.]|uniref:APC family permease n=1 Tax=Proteiniborus sp. TaxID=2079015 RepID=UPI0033345484
MSSSNSKLDNTNVLKRSLSLLYVYALATGAILTFLGYWDGVFLTNAGPATFLSFGLMTLFVLPIAFVYCELSAMMPSTGAELVYNTIGINKHAGFWSSWLIMAAWIAVPPAAVMGIISWIDYAFELNMSYGQIVITGIIVLVIYTIISLLEIELAGKIQTFMLFASLIGVVLTGFLFLFSGHWSISNFSPFIRSALNGGGATGEGGMAGWLIGTALLVTPYFGFETVPQMVEEGTFPIKSMSKAILGSVLTCGALYVFFFFALAGMGPWEVLTEGGTSAPFVAIKVMQKLGWGYYSLFFGIVGVLFPIGTCLLGFWISAVRLMYAMGRQNFLPKAFFKTNKHSQPILPNILILVLSLAAFGLMSSTSYLEDFFSLMAFACAVAYAISMISSIRLAKYHPEWERPYKLKGGQAFRWFALFIALLIAWLCTLGQNIGAWKGLGLYLGVGAIIWIWMIFFKWPKDKVWMLTPDGEKEF